MGGAPGLPAASRVASTSARQDSVALEGMPKETAQLPAIPAPASIVAPGASSRFDSIGTRFGHWQQAFGLDRTVL